jgi:hypothetical protein
VWNEPPPPQQTPSQTAAEILAPIIPGVLDVVKVVDTKTSGVRDYVSDYLSPYLSDIQSWYNVGFEFIRRSAGYGGSVDLRTPEDVKYEDTAFWPFLRLASLLPDTPIPDVYKQVAGFAAANFVYGASGIHSGGVALKALTSGSPLPLSTFLPSKELVALVEAPGLRSELKRNTEEEERKAAYSRGEAAWHLEKAGLQPEAFLGNNLPSQGESNSHYLATPYANLLNEIDAATKGNKVAEVASDILSTAHIGAQLFSAGVNLKNAVGWVVSNWPAIWKVGTIAGGIATSRSIQDIAGAIGRIPSSVPGPTSPGAKDTTPSYYPDYTVIFPNYWNESEKDDDKSKIVDNNKSESGKDSGTPSKPSIPTPSGSGFPATFTPTSIIPAVVAPIVRAVSGGSTPSFGGSAGSVVKSKSSASKRRVPLISPRKKARKAKRTTLPGGSTQNTGVK